MSDQTTPPPPPPKRKAPRGPWTRSQALEAGARGRATIIRKALERRALKDKLKAIAVDPPSNLPRVLREQISAVTSLVIQARQGRKPGTAEAWSRVLERLVKIEAMMRNGSEASSRKTKSTRSRPEPAKYLPPPRPAPATSISEPAKERPEPGPAPDSSTSSRSPEPEDLEPIPSEPVDD